MKKYILLYKRKQGNVVAYSSCSTRIELEEYYKKFIEDGGYEDIRMLKQIDPEEKEGNILLHNLANRIRYIEAFLGI